jgi:metallo-beta-lactamase family protein
MIDITSFGAAQSVTGSCHLITVNGSRILLDCGLFQGKRAESFERNQKFAFDPASIDVLVLSHAHIDHSGKIPMLVKLGFSGSIISTHATRDLANIMLLDSAFIQERDAAFVNKKHEKSGKPPVEAIYDMDDVLLAMEQFQSIGYRKKIRITENADLTFFDAGHILGSAQVVLDFHVNGTKSRFCFTGDLGRPNRPILRDPDFVGDIDILMTESTYGGRFHLDTVGVLERLEDIIRKTIARNGKIIVPAFSVGRTQELVYDLHQLFDQGRLPRIPIFVDSPLSFNATQVYRTHPECMENGIRREVITHHDPFGFANLTYITKLEESKALNAQKGPIMIISASGMCEAGRILHHLANNVEDPANTILITGYSAEHTLGRRIVENNPVINIFGEEHKLNADVQVINSLSAHADRNELLAYHSQFDKTRLEKVILVHGDVDQLEKLESGMKEIGCRNTHIAVEGETSTL